jgi:hypothetical protein
MCDVYRGPPPRDTYCGESLHCHEACTCKLEHTIERGLRPRLLLSTGLEAAGSCTKCNIMLRSHGCYGKDARDSRITATAIVHIACHGHTRLHAVSCVWSASTAQNKQPSTLEQLAKSSSPAEATLLCGDAPRCALHRHRRLEPALTGFSSPVSARLASTETAVCVLGAVCSVWQREGRPQQPAGGHAVKEALSMVCRASSGGTTGGRLPCSPRREAASHGAMLSLSAFER